MCLKVRTQEAHETGHEKGKEIGEARGKENKALEGAVLLVTKYKIPQHTAANHGMLWDEWYGGWDFSKPPWD